MPSSLMGVKDISISQHRATHTLSVLAEYEYKRKAILRDGFGNTFGNKTVLLPQSPIKQLTLAEREGFEPSVGLTLRLISSQVHSTTLPPLRTEYSL